MYQHYISHLTDVQIPLDQWLTNTLTPKELVQFLSRIQCNPAYTYNGTVCWLFNTAKVPQNPRAMDYATFIHSYGVDAAHRLSYVIYKHPIPRGSTLVVDHLCMRKMCIHPQHLELVTPAINVQRAREHYTALNPNHYRPNKPLAKPSYYLKQLKLNK